VSQSRSTTFKTHNGTYLFWKLLGIQLIRNLMRLTKPYVIVPRTVTAIREKDHMDPHVFGLVEPAVIFATLLGTALGVKLLIWGKGPIRKVKAPEDRQALEQRMAEFEDHLLEVAARQEDRLTEIEERLDFTERVLTQKQAGSPKAIEPPGSHSPDPR